MQPVSAPPLLSAAVVALCGIGLVVWWPQELSDDEARRGRAPVHDDVGERHLTALAELKRAGLVAHLEVADFGDGLGLASPKGAKAGTVLMRVPPSLVLDAEQPKSCGVDGTSSAPEAASEEVAACEVELAVARAVVGDETLRLAGLIALVILERRRPLGPAVGDAAGTPTAAGIAAARSAAFRVAPKLGWQEKSGIFAIDEEEFMLLGAGTSMEGWREVAVNETQRALKGIQGLNVERSLPNVTLEEVRWAYLLLHAQRLRSDDGGADEWPRGTALLWPRLLARTTPDPAVGAVVSWSDRDGAFLVSAPRSLGPGDELLFLDPMLSDASALCFRGLWLTERHRMQLSLDVSSAKRDAASQPLLDKYGCGAQPLQLFIETQKTVDQRFIGCMRLLALASNASRLQALERKGFFDEWPATSSANRRTEVAAVDLAIETLSHVLNRLSSKGAVIKQRFGADTVAQRPCAKVREAETMLVVSLLKSMKELQAIARDEFLFDNLRDSERERRRASRAKRKAGGASDAPDTAS